MQYMYSKFKESSVTQSSIVLPSGELQNTECRHDC